MNEYIGFQASATVQVVSTRHRTSHPSIRDRTMLGSFSGGDPRRVSVNLHSMTPQMLIDELHNLDLKIKHHEENAKYLGTLMIYLEERDRALQGSLSTVERKATDDMKSEETVEGILKHEKSAAAIICRLQSLSSMHTLVTDVVGIVATLGKVDDDNLSRLLSEYLGIETMLAVVCQTYDGVKALEAYDAESSIDKTFGIHDFAAKTGEPLSDRFLVISLENLRPYPGHLIADDPQTRLDLLNPRLSKGQTPPGFLGFAVNMINIDTSYSYRGHNLRETLFYHLFSNVQVYRSREDMLSALSCISTGAISLDGGMIKHPQMFSFGCPRSDTDVKFPKDSELNVPERYSEIQSQIKETKRRKDRTSSDLQIEQQLLNKLKSSYEEHKQGYLDLIAGTSPQSSEFRSRRNGR